jgi:hypothetical protein
MAIFNDSNRLECEILEYYNKCVKTENGTLQDFNDLDFTEMMDIINNYVYGGYARKVYISNQTLAFSDDTLNVYVNDQTYTIGDDTISVMVIGQTVVFGN